MAGMNKKPNLPDEIWLGKKEYSWWADLKVSGWLFVAVFVAAASDIMFSHHVREWDVGLRAVVAAVPFLAILLWARSLTRWIRGMDELHRRIAVAAVLFAVSATFFVVMLWHRLDQAGLFQAMFSTGEPDTRWDVRTVAHIFLLMTFFYFLGYRTFNRRYQ